MSDKLQTVYVPTMPDGSIENLELVHPFTAIVVGNVKELSGYFFTPEELNKLKREVAEKAIMDYIQEGAVRNHAIMLGDYIDTYLNTHYPIL